MDEQNVPIINENILKLEDIDNIIHEPTRLGILVLLIAHRNGLAFNQIQEILSLSPGNLSSHIQKLSKANYVEIIKMFIDLKPKTWLKITPDGISALKKYASNL